MDKITRYLLLGFIIIIFIVLAPLIVIYVSGKNIQFGNLLTKNTGIIDIQTNPSDAEVFINGVKNNDTPATVRFVKQGTHTIEIRKEGFRTWKKNLFIEAGKVTYAGSLSNEVNLLPNVGPTQLSDQTAIDSYALVGDTVLFTSNNVLYKYDLSEKNIIKQADLLAEITDLKTTNQDKYLLAKTKSSKNILINTETLQLINLPPTIADTAQYIEIDGKDTILALQNGNLISSDLETQQINPLLENVFCFTLHDNRLYTATNSEGKLEIITYDWNGGELANPAVLLSQQIPTGKSYQFYLTYQKELFVLIDQSLYRVNQNLDLLNKDIVSIQLDKLHRQLTYQTPSEIYYYNFLSSKAELFYRTSQPVGASLVVPNTGFGYIPSAQGLEAVEIDNRNGQNKYQLTPDSISSITITIDENNLIFLSNKKLFTIPIDN